MTPQEPPLAREALELAIESARLIVALGRNPFAAAVEVNSVAQALLTEHAELTALRARLAQAESKSDAEMERVKACEHIALGDDGWQVLRNLCPSTAAVAWLRDQLVVAEAENAVMVSALKGLVDAVANMRVPQNVVDAGLQINVTLGPAYEAAVAALSRHGNPAPQTERSE